MEKIILMIAIIGALNCDNEVNETPDELEQVQEQKNTEFVQIARVRTDQGFGYINDSGRVIIQCRYEEAGDFKEGLAEVYNGSFLGFIDLTGEKVIDLNELGITSGHDFHEGLRIARKPGKMVFDNKKGSYSKIGDLYGFMSVSGRIVIPMKFAEARTFSGGMAPVKTRMRQKWGFVDDLGHFVIEPNFEDAQSFSEGFAPVKVDGKWGFVDPAGSVIIKPIYDSVYSFSEGLAAVKKNNKYGFIDTTGHYVIEPGFDLVNSMKDGMIAVNLGGEEEISSDGMSSYSIRVGGKWGFIDREGNKIIDFKYDKVGDFYSGRAVIFKDGKAGWIDEHGKQVLEPSYQYLGAYSGPMYVAKENGKYGYVNEYGEWVIEPKYRFAAEFVIVKKD